MTIRTNITSPIQTLLQALTNPPKSNPLDALLATFTIDPAPKCHEHGLPQLAPFLGRTFTGQNDIATYFNLLSTHLEIHNMVFEPEDEWAVDESRLAVCLRGRATFAWKGTGQAWDETFVYRIKLAEELSLAQGKKGAWRVCEYFVWADTGAAYLARLGRLGDLLGDQIEGGKGGIYLDYDAKSQKS
ncbi:uncharacterized protein N7511_004367 [Penicillium nucicola]|uniref:uncharacterized protein n=1 Tax=Penicillium nucicola TaxID=1850975 RepID=UPI002544E1BA|nr:uncharacterized protein N7511_004367 [Penicillium nucicola]KAJ5766751.1 hypothetical protein N7511_004367 [Penicillium nucicola]